MRVYEMLEQGNREIVARIEELEAVDPSNSLERNIRFNRLREAVTYIYETKKRTFYAALSPYPETHEAVDHVQHLSMQVAGVFDALMREPMGTTTWEGLLAVLKEWLLKVISLEENQVAALARCYITADEEQRLTQEIGLEGHFLDQNKRMENQAETGFNDDYVGYKKAPDTPGKSHLPPKRWRMGSQ